MATKFFDEQVPALIQSTGVTQVVHSSASVSRLNTVDSSGGRTADSLRMESGKVFYDANGNPVIGQINGPQMQEAVDNNFIVSRQFATIEHRTARLFRYVLF
jgi:hypothetical protein